MQLKEKLALEHVQSVTANLDPELADTLKGIYLAGFEKASSLIIDRLVNDDTIEHATFIGVLDSVDKELE